MLFNLEKIIIIVGNYGSGKTEIAVNLAINRKIAGLEVRIGDLDLVNPYFRTRDALNQLNSLNIDVVIPPTEYFYADLPILSPKISGMIKSPSPCTILDVGGEKAGSAVLAALGEYLKLQTASVLQVVNPFRPFSDTIKGCFKILEGVESASKLKINGLIANPNLIDDTKLETIEQGYEFVKAFADKTSLPIKFIAISENFLPKITNENFLCPILPIKRQLVPPWKEKVKI
ncbi:MAG: cobalamin biosynthesis protein CbiA [Desulfobacterales bacterium]|nr:cobalamin biosynthesis protein CbiA [Desulfobacterales bacterium]